LLLRHLVLRDGRVGIEQVQSVANAAFADAVSSARPENPDQAMRLSPGESMKRNVTHLLRGATAVGLGLGLPAVEAQTCMPVSGHIALTSGNCTVAPGTALSASATSAAVSATNDGTVIDLTTGASIASATSRHGVDMIGGGIVRLGANTPITMNTSLTGVVGISITNSVIQETIGTGIPLRLVNATAGNTVSGYGLRAMQNSSVTLGLDMTSDFSRVSYGVRADSGSTVNLINASRFVLTGPDVAPGGAVLMAVDAGSVIDARNGTTLSNTGHDVTGIYMLNGGLVRVDASTAPLSITSLASINTGSAGVVADNTMVPAGTIDGISIRFAGIAGTGITATRGAHIVVDGAGIQGAGMGVVADTGSTVNISRSSISISDSNGGIVRTIEPSGATFQTTFVRQGAGLFALGGDLTADGVSISVPAALAYGVHSSISVFSPATAGTLTFANGTIMTSGAGSHGAVATGSPFVTDAPTLQLENATVTTTGSGGHGLAAFTGGIISATDSVIRAEGAGSYGLYSSTTSTTRQNYVSLSGGSLSSAQSTAIQVAGSQLNLSLSNGVQVAGGNGTLFQVSGAGARSGTLELIADSATLTGAALTDAGSTANMTLQNNTQWNLTGDSNVTRLVNGASAIAFSAPVGNVFKTLTVASYSGQPGSVIGLNTYLGADASPSDKVVIDGGTAIGQSGLRIRNTLAPNNVGPGALTAANGILVVNAVNGATTAPAAFTLDGRVTAGAYEYRLARGSVDGSNPDAWYLRSTQAPPPPASPESPQPPQPPQPPEAPAALKPLFRPEVAAYLANRKIVGDFLVHSLHDRSGEPQWTGQQGDDNDGARSSRSGWVRFVGKDFASRSADGNFDANSQSYLLQGGVEVARWSILRDDDRVHLGGMVGYGWGNSTGKATGNPYSAGSDTHGVNVGMYATWFQHDERRLGWYGDTWVQYGWYSNAVNGQLLPSVSYNTQAMAASAEGGYAWRPWVERSFAIEPQAQIVYAHGWGSTVTEPAGTSVDTAGASGWITRLGVRFHGEFDHGAGKRSQPYLVVNWWHDSVSNGVAFNQYGVSTLYPADRYEAKVGVDFLGRAGWAGWGNVGWQFGGQSYHALIGRVGVKYTW
jgi:autotransporter family porin